jgi:hypothetical protein
MADIRHPMRTGRSTVSGVKGGRIRSPGSRPAAHPLL